MKKEARRKTGTQNRKGTMRSPRSGAVCPTGAHPGNTGGKPGRSGRKPDEFKELLAGIRDEHGLPLLEQILRGEITYTINGKCSQCNGPMPSRCSSCGKNSTGPDAKQIVSGAPSPDVRARVLDMTMRYTVGLEKTIKLEGLPGAQAAFETIKARIRATLAPEAALALIDAISKDLKEIHL